jgi:outer membrane protein assembly factor BamD (BamD/ComL family)
MLSGICYRRIGQHKQAIEYYQHVVDNWPDYRYAWSAQERIAFTYEYLRDNGIIPQPEADILIKAAFEAVIEKYPNCPAVPAARSILNSKRFKHPGQEDYSLLKSPPPPPPPIPK